MKTKDFIGYIEERGGHVNILDHYVSIWESGDLLATVASDRAGKLNIEDYSRLLNNNMFQLIVEYCTTPIDRREEEKKQYVKVFDKFLGYLNIDNGVHNHLDKQGKPFIDTKSEYGDAITKFTDRDIEDLKKRNDIPLDWNKVHFEDAN